MNNTIVAVIMLSCPQFNKEIFLDFFCFFCFGVISYCFGCGFFFFFFLNKTSTTINFNLSHHSFRNCLRQMAKLSNRTKEM